ncbi:MAG TPA: aldo/keto reductase [Fimbriimonas sp.]|nr:aldo/keto reductase [Fimbriimonas sp.]
MEFVNLGRTGLKVSRICLGAMTYGSKSFREWVLLEEESRPYIKRALELGINFIDTADVYSRGVSEEIVGRAVKDFAKREEVVIATKVHGVMGDGPNDKGLSRKHILDSIDNSLRRLQMDYVDLYQIHRFDYETPIEETLDALDTCVRSGKVRYIGASSMYAWQFMKMLSFSRENGLHSFVSMQPQYNLIYREEEREMLPLCRTEGIGVIPWSPLARGWLTRPWDAETLRRGTDPFGAQLYTSDNDRQIVDRTNQVAKERGIPAAQVALAWVLEQPGITAPIIGASKPNHLEDAVAALEVKLAEEECAKVEELYVPHPVKDHG